MMTKINLKWLATGREFQAAEPQTAKLCDP